jgi:flagellar protein FliS
MFGTSRPGANAYRQMSVDTDALAASPHELIVMLFDGALRALDTAAAQMRAGDIEGKGRSLSKAIEIVGSGLAASLDLKAGGEIAANLASLYDYLVGEIVAANRRNDADQLDRARQLLAQMRASWVEIGGAAAPQGAHA